VNPDTVVLSLISHTNVGKTALARTLLRRDVGEVEDREHVTVLATEYVLIEQGDSSLRLWDTPGFASELRKKLLARLHQESNPIGWLLHQVWDRVTDKKLWYCQEAIRNVRDQADVVLYLVPADQNPAHVGYVDVEMEILGWIGKPVIVLLNQTGEPKPDRDAAEIAAWTTHLEPWPLVRGILALDAFASCWVQERELLDRVRELLPTEKRHAGEVLVAAWAERNLRTFAEAKAILGRWLADTIRDAESVPAPTAADWLGLNPLRQQKVEQAQGRLQERARERSRRATQSLIAIHELDGDSEGAILQRSGEEDFHATAAAAKPSVQRMLQGAGAGALAGLAVDLPAGGMAFGVPTMIGTVVGALGGLGTSYLQVKGPGAEGHQVRWSENYFIEFVPFLLRVYAAVVHHRRARGPWSWDERQSPDFWTQRIAGVVAPRKERLARAWKSRSEDELVTLIGEMLEDLLKVLYPDTEAFGR